MNIEMASVVSYQIESVWIFLKKGVYKFPPADFMVSNRYFSVRSLLRGYFCKIMCYGQQSKFNFHLLQPTKMEPLEALVVLEVSKYGFHILRPLAPVFKTFRRKEFLTFPFLDFSQPMIHLHNPFRPASVTPAS